jgi:glycosyltransferase involved in cell wall biosynthesis
VKILLATSFFPPVRNAGTEKRTFGYARSLIRRGHEVHVLCAGNYEEDAPQYWNGYTDEMYQDVPVRRVHLFWKKAPDPNAYLYRNPQTAKFLKGCIAEWKPDLIHITSCLTLSASIIHAAKDSGLPVVLTLTDFWFICHNLSLLKDDGSLCDGLESGRECVQCLTRDLNAYQKIKSLSSDTFASHVLERISKVPAISRLRFFRGRALNVSERRKYLMGALNRADRVTAPSNYLREVLQRGGVTREIQVIQSGHDLSWLEGKAKKTNSSRVRFGYIGQFIYTKGVDVLVTAFGKQDWQGRAELHLFGYQTSDPGNGYWQRLQSIENHNLQFTYYQGAFPYEKLGDILAGIDVLVVPSIWYENNPRVIQEAFAGRTPVIASDVGGIAEYVKHGVNGYLFRRGDSDSLASVMQQIVENPELLQQLAAHLPEVKRMETELDEIEALYQELLPLAQK